jgi:hypothetical protein
MDYRTDLVKYTIRRKSLLKIQKRKLDIILKLLLILLSAWLVYSIIRINALENYISTSSDIPKTNEIANTSNFNIQINEIYDLDNFYRPELCNKIIRSYDDLVKFNQSTANHYNLHDKRYNESFFEENAIIAFVAEYGQYHDVKPIISHIRSKGEIIEINLLRQFHEDGVFGDSMQTYGGTIEINKSLIETITDIEVHGKTIFFSEKTD